VFQPFFSFGGWFNTLDYTYNVHRGCHALFMSFWDASRVCEILHILTIVIHTVFFFGWFSFPWILLFTSFLIAKPIMERLMET
jgi:hypothetical protein